jgi:hypothetical protein
LSPTRLFTAAIIISVAMPRRRAGKAAKVPLNGRNDSEVAALSPGSVAWSLSMRRSSWTPSIVPRGDDQDVYLVVDDLGRVGRVWREADYEDTSFETVVADLLSGQYKSPIGIFCFNAVEGWSRTCRKTSPTSFGGDAIWKTGTCPRVSGISLSATKAAPAN